MKYKPFKAQLFIGDTLAALFARVKKFGRDERSTWPPCEFRYRLFRSKAKTKLSGAAHPFGIVPGKQKCHVSIRRSSLLAVF